MLSDYAIKRAFQLVGGIEPRPADYAVLAMLEDKSSDPDDANIATVAEYLWDHWMGEPTEPTLEAVERQVREAVKLADKEINEARIAGQIAEAQDS